MKNTKNNKIISFLAATTLALCAIMFANEPVKKVQAQYIWTCYASSTTGVYYWSHTNPAYAASRAMRICQVNTPFGFVCVSGGCE